MKLTRKGFIAALLSLPGITRLTAALRPHKPQNVLTINLATDLPVTLKVGDKLAIRFDGSEPKLLLIETAESEMCGHMRHLYGYDQHLPENGEEQRMFIAHRVLQVTAVRIASAVPGAVHWRTERFPTSSD